MGRVGSLPAHHGFSSRRRSWSQCWKSSSSLESSPRPSDGTAGHGSLLGLLSASRGAVSQEHPGGVYVYSELSLQIHTEREKKTSSPGGRSFLKVGKASLSLLTCFV